MVASEIGIGKSLFQLMLNLRILYSLRVQRKLLTLYTFEGPSHPTLWTAQETGKLNPYQEKNEKDCENVCCEYTWNEMQNTKYEEHKGRFVLSEEITTANKYIYIMYEK